MTDEDLEPGEGIWDDGEWISWAWINSQLEGEPEDDAYTVEPGPSRAGSPYSILEHSEVFSDLVSLAERYHANTGRYLQLWGELGEMYAEIKFGLRRHASLHPGSDGTIDGVLVEVKTISPEKTSDRVFVKRTGNFEKLLIVRIDRNFQFQGKLIERSKLREGAGQYYRARFSLPNDDK